MPSDLINSEQKEGQPVVERVKLKKKAKSCQAFEELKAIRIDEDAPYLVPMDQVLKGGVRITPELTAQMCYYLEKLVPARDACWLLQITEQYHYQWLNKGQAYLNAVREGKRPDKKHKEHALYTAAVGRALAEGRRHLISRSLNPDEFTATWIRDMTILERRDREHWQKSSEMQVQLEEYDPDESFL